MNERLEQEINEEYNPLDGLSLEDFRRIAQHFYNLALEEVRKEAKRLSIESPFSAAASAKMAELVKFIDNLKK